MGRLLSTAEAEWRRKPKCQEQEELKEQQKSIRRRKKTAERNERTKRLVEIGAVAEGILGREFKEGDNESFMKFLNRQ